MKHRDSLYTTIAVALTSFALAGVVCTDVYSQAAKVEVSGMHALTAVAAGATLWSGSTELVPQ